MLKKACLFGLLAATTVFSFGSVVKADPKNAQHSTQNAAAIGNDNFIRQHTNQINLLNFQQPTSGLFGSSSAPQATSMQSAEQKAGVFGVGNQIQQQIQQSNLQQQVSQPSLIQLLPF